MNQVGKTGNNGERYDPLDDLLAQPAEIADMGFSERLATELKPSTDGRAKVFLSVGACWAVMSLILVSPQTIYQYLGSIGAAFKFSEFISMPSLLNADISSLSEIAAQSSTSSLLLVGMLILAVVSLFISEQL